MIVEKNPTDLRRMCDIGLCKVDDTFLGLGPISLSTMGGSKSLLSYLFSRSWGNFISYRGCVG